MSDDRQQRAKALLAESEVAFTEAVRQQTLGARLFREYKALMRQDWDGSTIGTGSG